MEAEWDKMLFVPDKKLYLFDLSDFLHVWKIRLSIFVKEENERVFYFLADHAECWSLTGSDQARLDAFCMRWHKKTL